MEKKSDIASIAIFIGVLVLLAAQVLWFAPAAPAVAYSDFQRLLAAHEIDNLVVTPTRISGELRSEHAKASLPASDAAAFTADKPPWPFTTIRVADESLPALLVASGVRFRGALDSNWSDLLLAWIAPLVVCVFAWQFLMRRGGGARDFMGIGRSRARIYVQQATGATFNDIAGIDEAKKELQQIVSFLCHPERYRRLGGKIPKGILIVGAPGTGKTLLAKALAGEAGVPFFSISGSSFVEMFVGVGAARVRDLFEQAQQQAPCIVFIDELDALGKVRGANPVSGNDEREQTLNQLLVEMDGFQPNAGVILLAATNRPETLDPALLRPGRFDRHIAIDRPDLNGRRQILSVHARGVPLAPDVDLDELAARTPGCVGADLANIVNEAALHAAEADRANVGMGDFEEAIDRALAGSERKSRVMNAQEKVTIAYHEAGHALVAQSRAHCDPVKKVSMIPRGVAALGYTQQVPTEDRYVLRRSELLDRLDVLIGGRVSEELVFGDVSTGAENDLERATTMAWHMVARYGMSDRVGLVNCADDGSMPPSRVAAEGPHSGARTAQLIDDEVRRLLAQSHERVTRTLADQRAALDRIAKRLLEREVIEHDELLALIADSESADTWQTVVQPAATAQLQVEPSSTSAAAELAANPSQEAHPSQCSASR
ncbi:ATP-dependent zinc metalloprotease FtsH [Paraburkholderia guartelaensis]|uniref:ATP-dependent zinc metalloprotease FtsH n=1 Tax=Paraburkholderia guartelaensis TaxID=2546446 RepID=UPI002AB7108C|nr:ATP-dependent zinc metalloprotease FtsH [Paraburkholderia guartelaensis]